MCFGSSKSSTPATPPMGATMPVAEASGYERRNKQTGGNGLTMQDGAGIMVADGSSWSMGQTQQNGGN